MRLLRLGITNPLSRTIISLGLGQTRRGTTHLEEALRNYSGEAPPQCLAGNLYSLLFEEMMNLVAKTFDVDPGEIKEYFKDPTVRKGVSSVLKGIARYGVTRPQVLGPHFS